MFCAARVAGRAAVAKTGIASGEPGGTAERQMRALPAAGAPVLSFMGTRVFEPRRCGIARIACGPTPP